MTAVCDSISKATRLAQVLLIDKVSFQFEEMREHYVFSINLRYLPRYRQVFSVNCTKFGVGSVFKLYPHW